MITKIIKKILKEESIDKTQPLTASEIELFKHLNKNKLKFPTKNKLLEFIKSIITTFGKDVNEAKLYYEIYTQNYREEGDYENLTFDTFKNYREFTQRKTPNSTAYEYSSSRIPFKGSNLEGFWGVNRKNDWYYVVKSYGWFPIFLFIDNQWYGTIDTYSSTTGKHMAYSNPVRYNSGLKSDVIYLTKSEIDSLMGGFITYDEIGEKRVNEFVNNEVKNLIGKRITKSFGWGQSAKKVNFTIDDIVKKDDKVLIKVKINKAGPIIDRKMVVSPDGYDKRGEFAKDLEKEISDFVIRENNKFLTKDNVKFEFSH
jgi:hypothetical protein